MELEKMKADLNLCGQFTELRIDGKLVRDGLKQEADAVDSTVEDS